MKRLMQKAWARHPNIHNKNTTHGFSKQVPSINTTISSLTMSTENCFKQKDVNGVKSNLRELHKLMKEGEITLTEKTWNHVISCFAKHEEFQKEAIKYMLIAIEKKVPLNSFCLHLVMKAASKEGNLIYCCKIMDILKNQNMLTIYSFINMVNCQLFHKDVDKALLLIEEMHKYRIESDDRLYIEVLKACTDLKLLDKGKKLIKLATSSHKVGVSFETMVISFYVKCGDFETAIKLGESLKEKTKSNLIVWNCLIQAYSSKGDAKSAFDMYSKMKESEVKADDITFTILFKLCAKYQLVEKGKMLHHYIISCHTNISPKLQTSILNFYTKCGEAELAIAECEKMKKRGEMNNVSYTCLIQAHANNNDVEKAFSTFEEMKSNNIQPNETTWIILLSLCSKHSCTEQGRHIIREALNVQNRKQELSNCILNFYIKCGEPELAIAECEKMKKRGEMNNVSYTCLIQAYAEMGNIESAFSIFEIMKQNPQKIDQITLIILLTICSNYKLVEKGKMLHHYIISCHTNISPKLQTSILNFYTKCGEPELAIAECEQMKKRGEMNNVSYNCLIQAHTNNNDVEKAFSTFEEMKSNNIQADDITLIILLKACAENQLLEKGKQLISSFIGKSRSKELQTSILNFYIKCGEAELAIAECEQMKKRGEMNNVSYTCLIQAHANNNDVEKAFSTFEEMKSNNIQPSTVTFTILLALCAKYQLLELGKMLQESIPANISSTELFTTILSFYYRCKDFKSVVRLCEHIYSKSRTLLNIWAYWIPAYIALSDHGRAFSLFEEMKSNNIQADDITLIILLKACAENQLLEKGKQLISSFIGKSRSKELQTSILNFYTKCGEAELAIAECEQMKKRGEMNNVSYTCLIQAYAEMGNIESAFSTFEEMKSNNIQADDITLTVLFKACADNQLLEKGKQLISSFIGKSRSKELQASILNFYIKCGEAELAIAECEQMKERAEMNNVSYTCLIQAYAEMGNTESAFSTFEEMKSNNIQIDEITYIILLVMCAKTSSIASGKHIIEEIKRRNMVSTLVQSVIVLFHSFIGEIDQATKIFDDLLLSSGTQSPSVYNNMITCYSRHGKAKEALELFNNMKSKNIGVTDETYTSLLSAFAHSGMIVEAEYIFNDIEKSIGRKPSQYNITAMIDVYARAGMFEKAMSYISSTTDSSTYIQWSTVMGGCRKFNNLELAERVFSILTSMDRAQASPYVLLYNIYTYHNETEKANRIKVLMEEMGVKKIPGTCFFEHNSNTIQFISGSTELPRQAEIEQELEKLFTEITKAGYVPDTKWVTRTDLKSENEKIKALCRHAEKLAIAFAFVVDPDRNKIVLTKNLRVCNDCHNATAYISKVRKCEIIVSDANRYHHFKDGQCSCNNYW